MKEEKTIKNMKMVDVLACLLALEEVCGFRFLKGRERHRLAPGDCLVKYQAT